MPDMDFQKTKKFLKFSFRAIFMRTREEEVEIPFPQRNIHLKSGFENLIK